MRFMSTDRDALIAAMVQNGGRAADLAGVEVVAQYPGGIERCLMDLAMLTRVATPNIAGITLSI